MTTSRGSWPTEGFSDRRDSVLVEDVERPAKISGLRAPRGNMQAGVRAEEYLGKREPEKQVMMEVGVPGKPYENSVGFFLSLPISLSPLYYISSISFFLH